MAAFCRCIETILYCHLVELKIQIYLKIAGASQQEIYTDCCMKYFFFILNTTVYQTLIQDKKR